MFGRGSLGLTADSSHRQARPDHKLLDARYVVRDVFHNGQCVTGTTMAIAIHIAADTGNTFLNVRHLGPGLVVMAVCIHLHRRGGRHRLSGHHGQSKGSLHHNQQNQQSRNGANMGFQPHHGAESEASTCWKVNNTSQ